MTHQFKPFDKILYRDKDGNTWRPGLYGYQVDTNGGMHKIIGEGITYECVPYEGNERLLGTNDIIKSACPFNYGDHIEWYGGSGRWWKPALFIKVCEEKGAHGCTLYRIVDEHGQRFDIRTDFVRPMREEPEYNVGDPVEFCHGGDDWEPATYSSYDHESKTHSVADMGGMTINGLLDTHLRHRSS